MGFKVEITHLCVGQGLSVVTDITYPESNRYLLLFDLGSILGGRPFYGEALRTLSEKIGANQDTINYMHISHLDKDHYNRLQWLAAVHGREITIDRLVIGGVGNNEVMLEKRNRNLERELSGYMVRESYYADCLVGRGWPYGLSDHPQFPSVDIDLGDGYSYRMNPLLYRADIYPGYGTLEDSVAINTGSSLLLSSVVKGAQPCVSYLFTGDATRYTMEIFLKKCDLRIGAEQKLLTISHHGTKKNVADDDKGNFHTLNQFLDKYTPEYAVVSAKCKNQAGWAHPDINTIEAYEKKVTGKAAYHTVTAFNDFRGSIRTAPINVEKAIYSTFGIYNAGSNEVYGTYANNFRCHQRYIFQASVEKPYGPDRFIAFPKRIP